MKLRSCDLSIIFFFAASHSTPWMLSKSPGLPPPTHQLGSLSNLRRFDALIPLFDELRPENLIGEAVDQFMVVMNIL